jgi:hypothetical protein
VSLLGSPCSLNVVGSRRRVKLARTIGEGARAPSHFVASSATAGLASEAFTPKKLDCVDLVAYDGKVLLKREASNHFGFCASCSFEFSE